MITEISLKRFKCFESLEGVRLSRVCLLAGSNGRGKSSLLQALLLIAQSMDNEKSLKHIELNGELVEMGTFHNVMFAYAKDGCPSICYKTDDEEENEITLTFDQYKDKP